MCIFSVGKLFCKCGAGDDASYVRFGETKDKYFNRSLRHGTEMRHQNLRSDSVRYGTCRFHRYRCHVGTGFRYPNLLWRRGHWRMLWRRGHSKALSRGCHWSIHWAGVIRGGLEWLGAGNSPDTRGSLLFSLVLWCSVPVYLSQCTVHIFLQVKKRFFWEAVGAVFSIVRSLFFGAGSFFCILLFCSSSRTALTGESVRIAVDLQHSK